MCMSSLFSTHTVSNITYIFVIFGTRYKNKKLWSPRIKIRNPSSPATIKHCCCLFEIHIFILFFILSVYLLFSREGSRLQRQETLMYKHISGATLHKQHASCSLALIMQTHVACVSGKVTCRRWQCVCPHIIPRLQWKVLMEIMCRSALAKK